VAPNELQIVQRKINNLEVLFEYEHKVED
jgi:hypothetical protein